MTSLVKRIDMNTKLSDSRQGAGGLVSVVLRLNSNGLHAAPQGNNAEGFLDVCCCLSSWGLVATPSLISGSDGCPVAVAFTRKRQGQPQTALCASSCLPRERWDFYLDVSGI